MQGLVQWLSSLPVNRTIRTSTWLIPFLQTVHIMAIGVMLSSIVMLDLRIWGFARSQTLRETADRFLPWFWCAVAVVTVTGVLLVIGEPRRSLIAGIFQIKMSLMALALLVTVAFHIVLRRYGATWGMGAKAGRLAGALAAVVLVLWFADTVAGRGRWIVQLLPR